MVCTQARGNESFKSARLKVLCELLLIVLSVAGPTLVLWVPYYEHQYGYDDGYCWIKASTTNESQTFLYKFMYGYSLYEFTGFMAVTIAFGITIACCAYSAKLKHARRMINPLLMLLIAVITYMVVLNLLLVVDQNYHASYHLRIFLATFATLDDFIFITGYLLAFYFATIRDWLKTMARRDAINETRRQERESKGYATFKDSTRLTAPSTTHYNVPYTGEFTSISN